MKKNIIFFLGGLLIGGAGGVLATKSYFEKKYEAYAEETVGLMKQELMEHYVTGLMDEDEATEINPVISSEEDIKSGETPALSPEEIKRRLDNNHAGTNYAAIYGRIHPDSSKKNAPILGGSAVVERDGDEESEDEIEDEDEDDGETEMDRIHQENKGRKPRLISAAKVRELPDNIELVELLFYPDDEVLADGDSEERIIDVELLVGDCLLKYDFANSDERTIYVMNYELDTCYEVVKMDGSYDETH